MNSKISSAYLLKNYTYELPGLSLKVQLKNNPFNLEPETLFSLALRKNKRRRFLFVSKVLGKHIPGAPFLPLLAGAALAIQCFNKLSGLEHDQTWPLIQALKTGQQMQEAYESVAQKPLLNLPGQTLFIGFAETATALGQAVFSLFENAYYLHTTREYIPCLQAELDFREEHSHAVNHRCYPAQADYLSSSERIVLVDDELTTGNTALNIIRAIHRQYPKKNYVLLSLLDWRSGEHRADFRRLEAELDTKIHTISLMAGEIAFSSPAKAENSCAASRDPQEISDLPNPELDDYPEYKIISKLKEFSFPETIPVFSQDSLGDQNPIPYLKLTGRFGLNTHEQQTSWHLAQKLGRVLKTNRQGSVTLCLGTGEFMYFPMLVSAYMGDGVLFHSTTRSPIYTNSQGGYAIREGCAFRSPEDPGLINYMYNLPENYYDEVFVFLEREVSRERLTPLVRMFHDKGIPRLVFVICLASTEGRFLNDRKKPSAANSSPFADGML
ncbi:phosphoribosyltransferase family protein [Desulfosporosinus sp. PR]|uniref:phosphoribosyltransferase family protein n=1 Tax=Candidatus Desulfosporosinus nitrosoreducens TaxID=3401928 RepID=UPI0027F3EB8B|nr:phosphoribosyltransferase family protein [Desulfosporosinus sp. PR]MDQ7096882.1 phosphoribosyltransferase family protein [Desulfosporosinus sp. PR]